MNPILARRYDTNQAVAVNLGDGTVESVEPQLVRASVDPRESSLPILAPGLFDLQVNGHGGREFSSPELTVADVLKIANAMASQGVARFLPTVTTAATEVLEHAMSTIAAAAQQTNTTGARIEGIHLEGPFLSPEDGPRGAHPKEHCCPPSWELFERLQQAAQGQIRLVTMAAEYPEADEFIRRATNFGVKVAIGHTSAKGEQIAAAVTAGATLSTHLGNGAHVTLPRHPNYIWSQLAEDRLWASLIADGFHLPPEVLKPIIRAKTANRCFLISDMSGCAGMPPGRYQTSLCELELLSSGKIVVAGQETLLAAASMPLTVGIANIAQHTDVTRANAIDLASVQPARFLNENSDANNFLEPCSPADFTLLQWPADESAEIEVLATIVGGKLVFGSL